MLVMRTVEYGPSGDQPNPKLERISWAFVSTSRNGKALPFAPVVFNLMHLFETNIIVYWKIARTVPRFRIRWYISPFYQLGRRMNKCKLKQTFSMFVLSETKKDKWLQKNVCLQPARSANDCSEYSDARNVSHVREWRFTVHTMQ